jgi:membrane associated rhomboid family serine protease
MIPYKDDNPSRRFPLVSVTLLTVNGATFIYQHLVMPAGPMAMIQQYGFVPAGWHHFADLPWPAMALPWLKIITAMFMHGGWLHLIGNMLYLWIFGDNVEDRLGPFRYLIFYLLCGIGATLVHGMLYPASQTPTIGASGAIAGVMGAYLVFFPGAKVRTLMVWGVFVQILRLPALVVLGYWIVIQVVSGMAEYGAAPGGGIAWFAHIGGFVCGTGYAALVRVMGRRRR